MKSVKIEAVVNPDSGLGVEQRAFFETQNLGGPGRIKAYLGGLSERTISIAESLG